MKFDISFLKNRKFLYGIIVFLLALCVAVGGVFGYQIYQNTKLEKDIVSIHDILDSQDYSFNHCTDIIDFSDTVVQFSTETFHFSDVQFRTQEYTDFLKTCYQVFDISQQDQTQEFCEEIIKGKKSIFKDKYILLDEFSTVQEQCTLKYLTVTFSTGSLFEVENDFKSSIYVDFGLPFYQDTDDINSSAYIENRTEAKQRFLDLLEISPSIDITVDDIVLYPTSGTLFLNLLPETEYTFSLKSYDALMDGEKVETRTFTLITPKNTYFGLKKREKVTLFSDSQPVEFELISYDTEKTGAKIKICRISNEDYAKIEVFQEQDGLREEKKNFFLGGIDTLKAYNCEEKDISFDVSDSEKLKKQIFDFSDLIGDPARSGLYYVTFADTSERVYNQRVQEPIFFGIIDSHITMKISKNGDVFFFVNDLAGNPLPDQEIRVFVNDFISQDKKWNGPKQDYDITYTNPLEESVFQAPILLGKTNNEGVLEVNMKDQIDDVFGRTFQSWDFDWNGNYNSFFITSASETNLTYVSSKWNGGISGWNFGYTTGSGWWYGTSQNMDSIELDRWARAEPSLYSHVYTDRKLYLPGEEVFIKAILRNSVDLSIPKGKELILKIRNPKGEFTATSYHTASDYGSIDKTVELPEDALLGNYQVFIYNEDEIVGQSGFSVEVFKNPKFKNEVMLEADGLNGELVTNIQETTETTSWGYERKTYEASFTLKASVSSEYYSGTSVKNADFTYKVYKQYYYDNSYWDDCYYGCYWEPEKEFYTEGQGKLDENGNARFEIPVDFSSNYSDYKYIVEVTVTDTAGDKISGSNALIVRLPEQYKRRNPESGIYFETEKRFYKQGRNIAIHGGLEHGDFTTDYNDNFVLIIKKKEYSTTYVKDVRGYERPITKTHEKVEEILLVNEENFIIKDGKLMLNYALGETGEYVFEFGRLDAEAISGVEDAEIKDFPSILDEIPVQDLIHYDSKKYFTLISYGDDTASNPVESDNKITILSEKVSYKLGETARMLVRLPYSNGKILWTVEKQGVIEHEYIDIPGNTFFKEVVVDDTFVPNAYIGIVAIDTNSEKVPEYKVGYTEIVVDKTDKKSEITLSTDKETYQPRDEVKLDISVDTPSELTVMVVDDSLISLMGNIDTNTLEKFYKKLSFQIQTSITNIAMLKNYYFSRQGIVGGSGFGNFKGGDSAVSSRNIFKNTAYYNPSVITDASGKAQVKFTLPDNLTNFRIMVLSNSGDNFFGYAEDFIEVRKDVIVEDRTPLILRQGDSIVLGANIFNTTDSEIGFTATLTAKALDVVQEERITLLPAGESEFVSWEVTNPKTCGYLEKKCEIPYTISVLGDLPEHSDKIEGTIQIKSIPSLITSSFVSQTLEAGETADLTLALPENTNIDASTYTLSLSNNPLKGIEKIIQSLAVYPYGCGEQLLSTTMPNAILQRFTKMLPDVGVTKTEITKNLNHGLSEIYKMSLPSGAFKYWYSDTQGDVLITAYGVRVLLDIQDSNIAIQQDVVSKALDYLANSYTEMEDIQRAEALWTLAKYHGNKTESILKTTDLLKGYNLENMERHELIALTYGLVLANPEKYKTTIEKNINRIELLLQGADRGSYYYSQLSDMAEFTQLLMDYKADKKMISEYVMSLYQRDWESYWYSTKTKNNAFLVFARYIELYGQDTQNVLYVTLNGESKEITLGQTTNTYTSEVPLGQVLSNNAASLQIQNTSGGTLFATAEISAYPTNPLLVPPYADGVALERTIYEVVDSSDISETCRWNNGDRTCSEAQGLKLHTSDTFTKGATYKIILEAEFAGYDNRQNLTFEDYIPAGFSVLNNSFKTNEIATNQETSDQNYWQWSHVEKYPDVVMAHAKNNWGTTARYEYFVRADFEGSFIYPPAVVYLMYQPDTRANTEFRRVVVK